MTSLSACQGRVAGELKQSSTGIGMLPHLAMSMLASAPLTLHPTYKSSSRVHNNCQDTDSRRTLPSHRCIDLPHRSRLDCRPMV